MKGERVLEQELYETKFFDYRVISHNTATIAFVCFFQKELLVYEKLTRKGYFRNYLSTVNQPVPEWKHFKTFQDLRRWADANFIKYNDFWSFAFLFHREMGFKQCFPNVFKNKNLLINIKNVDKEKYTHQLKLADLQYFNIDNYTGEDMQNDYWNYVIKEIRAKYQGSQAIAVFKKLVKDKIRYFV